MQGVSERAEFAEDSKHPLGIVLIHPRYATIHKHLPTAYLTTLHIGSYQAVTSTCPISSLTLLLLLLILSLRP